MCTRMVYLKIERDIMLLCQLGLFVVVRQITGAFIAHELSCSMK